MRVDHRSFYADLFSKPAAAEFVKSEPPPLARRPAPQAAEPNLGEAPPVPAKPPTPPTPRALPAPKERSQPAAEPADAAAARQAASPLRELIGDVDMHRLSPRQMANLSSDLYAAGVVSFDDYAALAFQPELHPDFARTIGALTGERAEPDRPQDFVQLWEDRAEFQRRHNAARADLVRQSERIAQVLRRIDAPTNVVV